MSNWNNKIVITETMICSNLLYMVFNMNSVTESSSLFPKESDEILQENLKIPVTLINMYFYCLEISQYLSSSNNFTNLPAHISPEPFAKLNLLVEEYMLFLMHCIICSYRFHQKEHVSA